MTLDPKTLGELERMEKAATAGPWTWQREDASMLGLLGPRGEADHVLSTTRCEACQQSGGPCLDPKHADAHLIAALRNAAPALLAEAREAARLRERVAELEAKAGALIACIDRGEVGTTARHDATSALRAALTPASR